MDMDMERQALWAIATAVYLEAEYTIHLKLFPPMSRESFLYDLDPAAANVIWNNPQ